MSWGIKLANGFHRFRTTILLSIGSAISIYFYRTIYLRNPTPLWGHTVGFIAGILLFATLASGLSAWRGEEETMLSKFFEDVRSAISFVDRTTSRVWDRIVSWVYNQFPKQEGELDEDLEEGIQDSLLFAGARFKAFNRWVSETVELGFIALISAFILASTAMIVSISSFIPEGVFFVLLVIFGVFLITSILAIGFADLLLVLYTGSLVWFSLRKIRPNFFDARNGEVKEYTCQRDGDEISVYADNLAASIRVVIYSVLFLAIFASLLFSDAVLGLMKRLASFLPIQRAPLSTPLSIGADIVTGLNALLPIDMLYFSNPRSLESLGIIALLLLFFSVFLNMKSVQQHAERSRFKSSSIEPFSAREELKRCGQLIKICLYHLIEGELETEFDEVRGEFLEAGIAILGIIVLTFFHLYVLLNSI